MPIPPDLAAAIARAGVDLHLEERALQDAILAAIAVAVPTLSPIAPNS